MGHDLMLYYIGAIGLGALHAFEPGHGKTLIATYMIGTRGRAIDGIILGFIVTFTHTFSVILLGIAAKILSKSYSEHELHGWLGLVSALLILAVGIWMLKQRIQGKSGHTHIHLFGKRHDHGDSHSDHQHDHGDHEHQHTHGHADGHQHNHDHEHGTHIHDHADHDHHHAANAHEHHTHEHSHYHEVHSHGTAPSPEKNEKIQFKKWDLLLLGISGGLVPCPAAIAALLVAIAAGRIAQGLTMALLFSLGLGLVMMTLGVILSHARKLTGKIGDNPHFSRVMGLVSAVLITLLGSVTLVTSVRELLSHT